MGARGIRSSSRVLSDSFVDGSDYASWESNMIQTGTSSSSETSFSSDSPPKANYIEHRVSKMDTLPGVAIKYGVEVEDIKRLNGLMTDIQMFAHKTLLIPLPGKHPPSNCLSDNSVADSPSRDHTPPPCRFGADVLDLLDSMKTKTYPRQISSAMSSLQSYYGFTELKKGSALQGYEMTVYRTGGSCSDDEIWSTDPPFSDSHSHQDWKTTSLINGFLALNSKSKKNHTISNNAESIDMENSIRRRQKGDANESLSTPELQFKEENDSGFSGWKGKGLAARPKLPSKTEIDMAVLDVTSNGDSFIYAGSSPVRKSFSTPALQENENSSFIWPTSTWTLKTEDLVRPLLVGLPIPRSIWKNKAAVD
ncbi:uncharacterized protein LOC122020509 [Zingiber officinale]|uniref:LysM domain-containing protein n=1 Tax=Zingiber officinale TaxID=94328 RepID=A0A8J5F9A8_ZINOF|nr:uncharacterized protein LOC122020509 [Zingiber officinale]KAG6478684.1 hypothetical protein ZIOFF_062128 [Zingiber officinale]